MAATDPRQYGDESRTSRPTLSAVPESEGAPQRSRWVVGAIILAVLVAAAVVGYFLLYGGGDGGTGGGGGGGGGYFVFAIPIEATRRMVSRARSRH
jgi:hypothetical protein